jgi:hypothetical protein
MKINIFKGNSIIFVIFILNLFMLSNDVNSCGIKRNKKQSENPLDSKSNESNCKGNHEHKHKHDHGHHHHHRKNIIIIKIKIKRSI